MQSQLACSLYCWRAKVVVPAAIGVVPRVANQRPPGNSPETSLEIFNGGHLDIVPTIGDMQETALLVSLPR